MRRGWSYGDTPAFHGSFVGTDRGDLTVSVIVPTFNRQERLGRLLSALEGHHRAGARFDVVVAVDGSEDGTQTMLSALRTAYRIQVIVQPGENLLTVCMANWDRPHASANHSQRGLVEINNHRLFRGSVCR